MDPARKDGQLASYVSLDVFCTKAALLLFHPKEGVPVVGKDGLMGVLRANMELQSTTHCFKQSSCPCRDCCRLCIPLHHQHHLIGQDWFIAWTKRKITPFGCISLDRSRSILGMFYFVLVCWWFCFFFFLTEECKMRLHSLV